MKIEEEKRQFFQIQVRNTFIFGANGANKNVTVILWINQKFHLNFTLLFFLETKTKQDDIFFHVTDKTKPLDSTLFFFPQRVGDFVIVMTESL